MDDSERPERPGPDADAAEIAEWMEEDFGRAVAEGMANAGDEDEHEVVEVEILNHKRGEVVGTIARTGTWTRRARPSGVYRRSILRKACLCSSPRPTRTRTVRQYTQTPR